MDLLFRDWAGLPAHIVDVLVVKLDRFADYVHFCGVCPEWRCVALEANVDHKNNFDVLKASRRKLPMLLLDTHENNDEWRRNLYSVSDGKTYTMKLPLQYKYRFLGSSLGWLFCVEENMVITLVNPFKNSFISLPVFKRPTNDDKDYLIKKGILISDPLASPNNFGVVVLYTCVGKLALFKSGDCCWNYIKSNLHVGDIIYYKDELYGISFWGQFVQIDLDSGTIKTIIRGSERKPVDGIYLVESQDGELLMVQRIWVKYDFEFYVGGGPNVEDHLDNEENPDNEVNDDNDYSDTDYEIVSFNDDPGYHDDVIDNGDDPGYHDDVIDNGDDPGYHDDVIDNGDDPINFDEDDDIPFLSYEFKVFKMTHLTGESPTWVEINNIGEQALFVGDNHSVSVSTTEFPGCMSNSIYYTSEHHHEISPYTHYGLKEDSGIFNFEDGRIYKHHVSDSYKCMHPPIWFLPNLS